MRLIMIATAGFYAAPDGRRIDDIQKGVTFDDGGAPDGWRKITNSGTNADGKYVKSVYTDFLTDETPDPPLPLPNGDKPISVVLVWGDGSEDFYDKRAA